MKIEKPIESFPTEEESEVGYERLELQRELFLGLESLEKELENKETHDFSLSELKNRKPWDISPENPLELQRVPLSDVSRMKELVKEIREKNNQGLWAEFLELLDSVIDYGVSCQELYRVSWEEKGKRSAKKVVEESDRKRRMAHNALMAQMKIFARAVKKQGVDLKIDSYTQDDILEAGENFQEDQGFRWLISERWAVPVFIILTRLNLTEKIKKILEKQSL